MPESLKNPRNWVRVLFLALVLFGCFKNASPNEVNLSFAGEKAFLSAEHPLGCDRLGRDNIALFSYGAVATILLCIPARAVTLLVSFFFSFLSYIRKSRYSLFVETFSSVFLSLPSLLVALVVLAVFPETKLTLLFAIVLSDWAMSYESIQAKIRDVRQSGYVAASLSLGGSSGHVFIVHFLPALRNLFEYLFLTGIPSVIMTTALFSYLGVDTSLFDWGPGLGEQISFSKDYFEKTPVSVLLPILGIIGLVYSFGRDEK
ncbi:ABC transporter permease subunit [Leptospira idonii]|uniref:ABC transporter permease subunit n=1 Tax=Leptospira idonii TaxID=1193500 RepID=A0A4R9LYF3_9LEPT|nr:ABC transporter permease subunit [Leptospira idonii]TGN19353.1 ABC transporter permease subunit [Leptospira idonii]